MRAFSRKALVVFVLGAAASMAGLYLLDEAGRVPFAGEGMDHGHVVAISLYNGLSLAGLATMARFLTGGRPFALRLALLVALFMFCVAMRAPLDGGALDPAEVVVSVLWEAGRAVGVAFAVAYIAHAVYSRYLPTTLLRARDVTPLLVKGRTAARARANHAKNARWLFDMGKRPYLDTTKLELRDRQGPPFTWADWGEVSFWSGVLLLSFTIYVEVYPRVADSFGTVLTSVMSGHLLTLIPLLLLMSYPVDRLGAVVPVEGRAFHLAQGFRHTSYRWTKLSFLPIIVIALLVRWDMVQQDWESLANAMLICLPTAFLINLVYLECFRHRTVAEVHRAIPRWEERELGEWGEEPWRRRSLMEGVEPRELDVSMD